MKYFNYEERKKSLFLKLVYYFCFEQGMICAKLLMNYNHLMDAIKYLTFFQKKLTGYEFPVYTTHMCPRNETEWSQRSSSINCTKSNSYICIPNENLTELLEFCYIYETTWIPKGNVNSEL